MATISGFLGFCLFIALIVGLIKPVAVLRWDKKPTRLKVVGYWLVASILVGIIGSLSVSDEDRAKSSMDLAKSYFDDEKYEQAISSLKDIKEENPLYGEAQSLIARADSLSKMSEEEKQLAKEIESKKAAEENRIKQKEQLKKEIQSINDGVDFSTYRGAIDALQMELVLFGTWATIIEKGESSDDQEIQKLAKQLKQKVINLQVREFPILRKEYAKVVSKKMWENDIEVTSNGKGHRYINFTGGIFAANKNKKDFQNQIHGALTMFRFTQSRYRWYEGEEEYTYWKIYEGKDSDLVEFDK